MNTKLHGRLMFSLILIIVLILTQIPGYFCQYDKCRQPFKCGYTNINYPFWGGDQVSCGYPGFEVECDGNDIFLHILKSKYRVIEINFTTQIMRIAREDLWNTYCSSFPFYNTTLDFTPFDYYSNSNYRNITLYYGCNTLPTQVTSSETFSCSVNGKNSTGFIDTGEGSVPAKCNTNIFVPVDFNTSVDLSVSGFHGAIAKGFEVKWLLNSSNCDNCVKSGGECGYTRVSASFVCYCTDRPHTFTCNDKNGSRGQKYVILAVSLSVTGTVILSIFVVWYFKNRGTLNDRDKENLTVENFILNHESLARKRYTYSEVKKVTKYFTDQLGQGGFGSVYKGTLPDGRLVAVKVLTETNSNSEDFLNEVASISRTSHVNIVNLLGFCYDKKCRALVYEFMPNKSLDKFIYKRGSLSSSDNIHLGLNKLYEIAVGVARGLEYLHRGCNTRIVHFDIKPQNILLDEDFCPKISDFGLAQLCKKKQSILSVFGTRGTIGYIAPEVFCRSFGSVSHKSDVYSYGMMVLEMAGARKIEETAENGASESYFPDKVYEQGVLCKTNTLLDETMSEEEEETARKMFLVGFWCIQTVPSERPSVNKVVEMLEGSVQSIQIPPKPFLASPMLPGQQFSSSFLGNEILTEC